MPGAARADPASGPRAVHALTVVRTRARSLAWAAAGGRAPAEPGFRILFYHRVSDERDELAVAPARFREQMQNLAAQGYRGVDVVTAVGAAPGAVGLAFDGGFLDLAEHVVPELERHGFRATVFVATGVTDGRVPLLWHGSQPPLLSWDDIRRLDGGALGFEAQTITRPNLLEVGEEEAREEIAGSKQELEERLGRPVTAFCYPAGLYSARDVRLCAEAGFSVACTSQPGLNTQATSPLELGRIQIRARDSLLDFRAKLGGGFDRAGA